MTGITELRPEVVNGEIAETTPSRVETHLTRYLKVKLQSKIKSSKRPIVAKLSFALIFELLFGFCLTNNLAVGGVISVMTAARAIWMAHSERGETTDKSISR